MPEIQPTPEDPHEGFETPLPSSPTRLKQGHQSPRQIPSEIRSFLSNRHPPSTTTGPLVRERTHPRPKPGDQPRLGRRRRRLTRQHKPPPHLQPQRLTSNGFQTPKAHARPGKALKFRKPPSLLRSTSPSLVDVASHRRLVAFCPQGF